MKKIYERLQIIIVCVLIISLTVAFVILPDKFFSDKENRNLKQMPKLDFENISNGKFTSGIADYFADQFPFRDTFVAIKAYSELLLAKHENNGVIKSGNYLIARPQYTENRLKENLEIISDFEKSTGTKIVVAALPRSIDVFSEILPKTYPKSQDNKLWKQFFEYSKSLSLSAPDVYTSLTVNNEYYRTDHHYTTHGAYNVYCVLGKELGYTPLEKSFFNIETVTKNFCGTAMRTSGYYLEKKDTIELFRYPNDEKYSVTADGKESALYDFEKLNTTDSYAVFLGGNHERVDIVAGEGREKLLIIRDSFADSIAPFLSLHYDITLLDLRYFNGNVQEIVKVEKFDKVLIFESITELCESKNLSYLSIPFNVDAELN